MADHSEKYKNYAIATLCLVSCIFLISILYFINNGIKEYKQQILLQSKFQEEINLNISEAYKDYKNLLDKRMIAQQKIVDRAEASSTVLSEISLIVSTRLLEEENMISKAEADILVLDSIREIKNISPRIAEMISIFNKKFINTR